VTRVTKDPILYRDAGVDVEAGDSFVRRIRTAVEGTRTPRVLGSVGAFSGLFRADFGGMSDPVLVASTDGVGTKLKLAFATGAHDVVGGDLVRHCANDVCVMGAEPLFFLDYLATGRLEAEVLARVVEGMAEACREEGVALLGGETAEMPGFYAAGEYDVSGFLVGVVDRARILDGSAIRPGDRIAGFASSGLHTNGYSLARAIVDATPELALGQRPGPLAGASVAEALLAPHLSYTAEIRRLREDPGCVVRGLAHVTGGGIGGNLRRILPANVSARIRAGSWTEPPIFELLRRSGPVPEDDMRRTFNLGIGLVAVLSGASAGAHGIPIGEIVEGRGGVDWVD
jgi:phosphoribosylformylglycinamidine cyclo-ligase